MKRAARHQTGTIVFDKRRGTWNFLQWVDGKRKSKLIGMLREFPTKGAAWRAAQALPSPKPKPATAPTVSTLVEQYRQEKMPTRYSTRRSYDVWLRLRVLPRWGESPITDLQARPVELWLQSLTLAPRSLSSIRGLVGILWDFAMWRGDLPTQRNPMQLVTVKNASRRTRKPHSLTVEEFQRFLLHLDDPFRTVALVCVCFGLRISECLGLKWSDIDWLDAKLSIERGIVRQRVDFVKTEGSERKMSISPEILDVLKLWKQKTQFPSQEDWVFASPVQLGRLPWSADSVNDAYRKATRAAGVGHVSTHSMRHTYRSWLDAVGTQLSVQQRLMRHADIRTTMNVYGSIVTNEMAEAGAKVAGLALNGSQADRRAS